MRFEPTRSRLIPPVLLAFALAACQPDQGGQQQAQQQPAEQPPAQQPAQEQVPDSSGHEFAAAITAEDFAQHVQVLASDAFLGRAPGGLGEQRTIDYLTAQFQRLGLQPGNGDSYTQTVPMVSTQASMDTTMTLSVDGQAETLEQGGQMVLVTRTAQPAVTLEDSEMVFVGYGVNAPEAGWNDYEGLDVKGKTVVMLVNDPGFHVGDEKLFAGKRMTYYGRWTYKYEEAARQGAAAALIIHDTEGAGYGWDVVRNSWTGEEFDLPTSVDPEPRIPLQGWLTQDAAQRLFERSGHDLAKLREAANARDFEPVPLGATMSAKLESTSRTGESRNALAILRGSERPDEVIIYTAHWDHLGRNENLEGDQIFNGAVDNATGVAGLLEIAEAFVRQNGKPERSVMFLAVTLEESGLLGAKYYAANPPIPLAQTVAVINMDAMVPVGRTEEITVIGLGASELEDILRPIVQAQGRSMAAEEAVEKGYYYRSDHFAFAKAGVPALYAKSGSTHVEKGPEHVAALAASYTGERYHKPDDEYDPDWDLSGIVEDLQALYRVGREIADGDMWPNWYQGNEFRAVRDAVIAAKEAQAEAESGS